MPDKIEVYYERDGSQKILLNGQVLESVVGFDIVQRFDDRFRSNPWDPIVRPDGIEVTLHLRVQEVQYYDGSEYEARTHE